MRIASEHDRHSCLCWTSRWRSSSPRTVIPSWNTGARRSRRRWPLDPEATRCTPLTPRLVAEERIPVIMDVDTGVDDCIALLFAVASPNVELVAATCCAGNVVAPRATANTLAVLELAGAGDVEVALGGLAPLVAPLRTPISHGPNRLGDAQLTEARRAPPSRLGPHLLIEEGRPRAGAVTPV